MLNYVKVFQIMKDIMAKESSDQMQGVPSFEYNPATLKQPLLFELNRPLDELEGMLLDTFAGKTMTMKEIYDQHHVGKPYISKNYKKALSNLESQGKITVHSPVGKKRRQGTFADDLKVTFPLGNKF
jgi:DNA-directed RNA polymerase specialized sigma subunit